MTKRSINLKNSYKFDVNLRMKILTSITTLIVVFLAIIYFTNSYANKRNKIIQTIKGETSNIENAFVNDINYSQHIMSLIIAQLHNNHNNTQNIEKILKDYVPPSDYSSQFGWRKYSWINSNFKETVTSTNGVESCPRSPYFIENLVRNNNWKNQTIFYINKPDSDSNSLKLISSIAEPITHKYIGSVVLSYDVNTMIKRLYNNTNNPFTNFVILNDQFEIVVQSKRNIKNIIDSNEKFFPPLDKLLKPSDNDFVKTTDSKVISYLNMFNGVNYHIKRINNLPFILIVSLDSDSVSNAMVDNIIKKLLEISIFAVMFFLSVVSIYRRETWLRSRAEQATIIANKANKAKTDFLTFTAHEIRSPLGFILTGSEMISKKFFGELSQAYVEYAEGIYQNSKIILDFITDILDENQIIGGKFKIINSKADIKEIINKAVAVNKTRFSSRKIFINVDIQDNLPELTCDQRRILQVMSNLISNSVKYSEDNTKITISAKIINSQMYIEVHDQGIGMSEEEIQSALNIYGEATNKRDHKLLESYGLGLPIVKMLLDAHEAELEIRSIPCVGTMVRIIFHKDKLK